MEHDEHEWAANLEREREGREVAERELRVQQDRAARSKRESVGMKLEGADGENAELNRLREDLEAEQKRSDEERAQLLKEIATARQVRRKKKSFFGCCLTTPPFS